MFITTTVIHDVFDLHFVITTPLKVPLIAVGDKTSSDEQLVKNMCIVSLDPTAMDTMIAQDFMNFVPKFLAKKKQEIAQKGISDPVVFYMWFDAMAAQLRFNTVIAFNEKLPFGCKVDIVNSPESILEEFLASHYHDGIAWGELEELDDDSDEDEKPFVLKVYVAHLN